MNLSNNAALLLGGFLTGGLATASLQSLQAYIHNFIVDRRESAKILSGLIQTERVVVYLIHEYIELENRYSDLSDRKIPPAELDRIRRNVFRRYLMSEDPKKSLEEMRSHANRLRESKPFQALSVEESIRMLEALYRYNENIMPRLKEHEVPGAIDVNLRALGYADSELLKCIGRLALGRDPLAAILWLKMIRGSKMDCYRKKVSKRSMSFGTNRRHHHYPNTEPPGHEVWEQLLS